MFPSDTALTIACPQCGHKIQQSIRRLQAEPTLACPGCGVAINIKSSEGGLKALDSTLKKGGRKIRIKIR